MVAGSLLVHRAFGPVVPRCRCVARTTRFASEPLRSYSTCPAPPCRRRDSHPTRCFATNAAGFAALWRPRRAGVLAPYVRCARALSLRCERCGDRTRNIPSLVGRSTVELIVVDLGRGSGRVPDLLGRRCSTPLWSLPSLPRFAAPALADGVSLTLPPALRPWQEYAPATTGSPVGVSPSRRTAAGPTTSASQAFAHRGFGVTRSRAHAPRRKRPGTSRPDIMALSRII